MARPISIRPLQGGQLITRAAADTPGLANYRVKRDFRRVADREVVREGHDYFRPNKVRDAAAQYHIGEPLTCLFLAHGANTTAILGASKSKLYRFSTLNVAGYVSDVDSQFYFSPTGPNTPYIATEGVGAPYINESDESDYIAPDASGAYFDDNPGLWEVIGDGFSLEARRWEAVEVGEQVVFNNGVDLPVTFDLRESKARPIYELREQGVARVGTIAETNGLLVCADVWMVREDKLLPLFALDPEAAYGVLNDSIQVRVPHRVLWSMNNAARRFAASVPCSAVAGTNRVTLRYPVKSLEAGQEVLLLGAGLNGGNLTTTIQHIHGTALRVAGTIATEVAETLLSRSDVTGSIASYEDLEDDGSPILKMLALSNRLILYRDTTFFIAAYTGNPDRPFEFVRRDCGPQTALYYRHTLVAVNWQGQAFHLYAGRNSFFRLDLASQHPALVPTLDVCSNLFFDQVRIAQDNDIFAVNNAITNEVFICFPSKAADQAICFDYKQNTASTTGAACLAAASVKRPNCGEGARWQSEDWFIMSNIDGKVLLYGRTNEVIPEWGGTAYFARLGRGYPAVLESGLSSFGDSYNEKQVLGWLLNDALIATSPKPMPIPKAGTNRFSVTFELLATQDADKAATVLGARDITAKRYVPLCFLNYYFADRVTVNVYARPFEVVEKVWEVIGSRSDSYDRRP